METCFGIYTLQYCFLLKISSFGNSQVLMFGAQSFGICTYIERPLPFFQIRNFENPDKFNNLANVESSKPKLDRFSRVL